MFLESKDLMEVVRGDQDVGEFSLLPPPLRLPPSTGSVSATLVWAGERKRGHLGAASPSGDRLVRPQEDGVLGAGRAAEPGKGSGTALPWSRGPSWRGRARYAAGSRVGTLGLRTRAAMTSCPLSSPAPPQVLASRSLPPVTLL